MRGNLLPFGSSLAVVAIGIDGNAASGQKFAPYFDILGVQQSDEVLHDDVDAVLMEIPMIAEGEEIEFQALALHQFLIGDIGNINGRKIRLAGDGTQACELRTVELDKVIIVRMFVVKGLQDIGIVICVIIGVLAAQQSEVFVFSRHGVSPFDDHSCVRAGSCTPLAANAAARSMQVPHLPQGFSPPS